MKLELIRSEISDDTVRALVQLAEDAGSGVYTGFAIALLRPRLRYSVHCIGEACERPTWTRGILNVLDDELREMIRIKSFEDTR